MGLYKFKSKWDINTSKWDINTSVEWQKECRTELNYIIDHYNKWQMEDDFSKEKSKLVLAKIEYGKQTIGSVDGGSGYWDELDEMEKFVKSCIEK